MDTVHRWVAPSQAERTFNVVPASALCLDCIPSCRPCVSAQASPPSCPEPRMELFLAQDRRCLVRCMGAQALVTRTLQNSRVVLHLHVCRPCLETAMNAPRFPVLQSLRLETCASRVAIKEAVIVHVLVVTTIIRKMHSASSSCNKNSLAF